ncbi:lipid A deacylase LpxR family protein [Undibacterium griseum]|uniref:Lipid A deacylase LpxR family protein n=1 Tax=Undibacterium griseum TaxID=2762295 RepID=A0ABR6YQN9_9BURK|nr:lipid A deacylase LpxR family protein [Undibacterium griseum]MBC3886218.1 lipid A deacylase LpxR family protein [Undibacterium griseum]
MMTRKFLVFAVCSPLWLSSAAVLAADSDNIFSWQEMQQARAQGKSVWQLEIENDSLLLNRDDRYYTSGIHLQQTSYLRSDLEVSEYGWRFGQDLYTPTDIKLPPSQIPAIDHPYTGWLYAGMFHQKTAATGRSWRVGLDLGCSGHCAGGEWTQNHLHWLIQQPLPQGWSTQYRSEFGAILSGEYSPGRLLPFSGTDLTPRIKARFGNVITDAGAQLEFRAGQLNALPYQPASYGFARIAASVTGYNATIEGGYFNHEIPKVHAKHSGGEIEAGYLWQGDRYALSASIIRRANEIKEVSNAVGAQNFVRLQFSCMM